MYVLNVHNWYCVIEIIVSFSCFYKYFWLLHSMVLKDLIPCGTGPRPRWANQSPSYPELFELKLRKKENFSSVEAINVKHRSCQQSCILPCGSSWSAKKENEADMQKAVEVRNSESWKISSPWFRLFLKLHFPALPMVQFFLWFQEPVNLITSFLCQSPFKNWGSITCKQKA